MKNCDFNEHRWKEVGQKVIEGIYEYIKLILEIERIKEMKIRERQ